MGCGVCGAFPFLLAGMSTTMANIGNYLHIVSNIYNFFYPYYYLKIKLIYRDLLDCYFVFSGVIIIICKGDVSYLINFKFTSGDLWMLGAAIGWAVYSIFLLTGKVILV